MNTDQTLVYQVMEVCQVTMEVATEALFICDNNVDQAIDYIVLNQQPKTNHQRRFSHPPLTQKSKHGTFTLPHNARLEVDCYKIILRSESYKNILTERVKRLGLHSIVKVVLTGNFSDQIIENSMNQILCGLMQLPNGLIKSLIDCNRGGMGSFSDLSIVLSSDLVAIGPMQLPTPIQIPKLMQVKDGKVEFYCSLPALKKQEIIATCIPHNVIPNALVTNICNLIMQVQFDTSNYTSNHMELILPVFSLAFELFDSVPQFLPLPKPIDDLSCLPEPILNLLLEFSQSALFSCIMVANNLQVHELLDIFSVAAMIKGKSPEEIRLLFNIKNDFTPEEEEEVRASNEWSEE